MEETTTTTTATTATKPAVDTKETTSNGAFVKSEVTTSDDYSHEDETSRDVGNETANEAEMTSYGKELTSSLDKRFLWTAAATDCKSESTVSISMEKVKLEMSRGDKGVEEKEETKGEDEEEEEEEAMERRHICVENRDVNTISTLFKIKIEKKLPDRTTQSIDGLLLPEDGDSGESKREKGEEEEEMMNCDSQKDSMINGERENDSMINDMKTTQTQTKNRIFKDKHENISVNQLSSTSDDDDEDGSDGRSGGCGGRSGGGSGKGKED